MAVGPVLTERVRPLHRTFTRELSRLAEAVPEVPAGDQAGADAMGTWAFDVVDALHHYLRALESWVRPVIDIHEGDDAFAADVVRAAARDQRALESVSQRALAAAVRWQDGAGAEDRDALAVHLRRLRSGTAIAFPRIEGDLGPLADRLVDEPRAAAVARHPVVALGGRRGRAVEGALLAGLERGDEAGGHVWSISRLRRAAARREYRRRTAALTGRLP